MNEINPKITVVGAGAIGGVTAALLTKAGYDVTVICKHKEIANKCRAVGVNIFGRKSASGVSLKTLVNSKELDELQHIILLATKATECVAAARDLLPWLSENSILVSLQNGICEYDLAKVVGGERIVGCVVGWGATMHGPGEFEVTSTGEFVIGNITPNSENRLTLIQEVLNSVMPTRISDNIMGELYSKLIINSCINSLGAITGLTLGRMLGVKKVRNVFIALMREMMEVAAEMGIVVEPGGGGKIDYYRVLANDGIIPDLKRHLLIRLIGFKYRKIKSSSLQSLERGRNTEIEFLNGYVCRQAREMGISTPLNEHIVKIIKEIESGARKIKFENLTDPMFASF